MPELKENEMELMIDGNEIVCSWWTKDVGDLFCSLCGKRDSEECLLCQNNKPWCG